MVNVWLIKLQSKVISLLTNNEVPHKPFIRQLSTVMCNWCDSIIEMAITHLYDCFINGLRSILMFVNSDKNYKRGLRQNQIWSNIRIFDVLSDFFSAMSNIEAVWFFAWQELLWPHVTFQFWFITVLFILCPKVLN